ncbi:ABC transporter ATP-binding protein [Brevibacillus sp. NRS-1366]|uniref:ABC transporter ATP-binding protein n=1 Tax=Brevibacillus sp. NRS-1366 TaxID=3233899 RepID=UPI003D241675
MEKVILEIEHLRTTFNTARGLVKAVDDISLRVYENEILGIVGESGCGKSVTSLSIMGLLPQSVALIEQGSIRFDGMDLVQLPEEKIRRIRGNQIAMIFQEPMTSLNPVFTIGEQLSEPLRHHTKLGRKERRKKIIEMLNLVGIPRADEIIDEYPHQLSGGMRQRVMISLAMLCRPKLLIADEPTTALDVTIQAQIVDLMKTIQLENNMSILLITHDLGVVAEMCHRVVVMYAGKVVESADVRTIFNQPKHPYTRGLLASLPTHHEHKSEMPSIPGNVPRPDELPTGCSFAPRCSSAFDKCLVESPPLYQFGRQECRCWLYENNDQEVLADAR